MADEDKAKAEKLAAAKKRVCIPDSGNLQLSLGELLAMRH